MFPRSTFGRTCASEALLRMSTVQIVHQLLNHIFGLSGLRTFCAFRCTSKRGNCCLAIVNSTSHLHTGFGASRVPWIRENHLAINFSFVCLGVTMNTVARILKHGSRLTQRGLQGPALSGAVAETPCVRLGATPATSRGFAAGDDAN